MGLALGPADVIGEEGLRQLNAKNIENCICSICIVDGECSFGMQLAVSPAAHTGCVRLETGIVKCWGSNAE
eukprot:972047-Rhodomonas_salina.1